MITDVRAWLKKHPSPAVVRCTCPDGVPRSIRLDSKNSRKFVEAADAIMGLHATELEALDAKGHTLRTCELELVAGADDAVPPAQNKAQSDLAHFASLVSAAYKQGAESAKAPTELAFTTLGHLIELVFKRLGAVEAQQIRQLNAAARAVQGAGVDADGDGSALLVRVLDAFTGGKVSAAAQGQVHANGAAVPDAETEGEADDA